jgi:hypothetical protein
LDTTVDTIEGLVTSDVTQPDNYWVNPYGQSFRQITVSDLVLVEGKTKTVIQAAIPWRSPPPRSTRRSTAPALTSWRRSPV